MRPYWQDDRFGLTLFLGDCRELTPQLVAVGLRADLILADPPYQQTSLAWDRWPAGWLDVIGPVLAEGGSMWHFGTLRLFMDRAEEFRAAGWRLAQDVAGEIEDVLWEKQAGTGFQNDRFMRVHEQVAHFYKGAWGAIVRNAPRESGHRFVEVRRTKQQAPHLGAIGGSTYGTDTRLVRSIIRERNGHRRGMANPTAKPPRLLECLINYSSRPGSVVYDPFFGGGSTALACAKAGRYCVGVELREEQAEKAVRWVEAQLAALSG